ncbi:MAG: carnitine 3-dehydrogenase, partial [Halieaceae bacterium]|nr:carnitine 3-dehydrogenase [Halieaceae bacterium]
MTDISRVAVIGAGVIGAGWVARFMENGIDVALFDPAPDAATKVKAVLDNADRAYQKLTMAPRAKRGNLEFSPSLAEAVQGKQLVMEAVPESLALKQSVYKDIESHVDAGVIIASSTSGILPTQLQEKMANPQRLLVAHPFNPVYLLPLVEIVAGEQTSPKVTVAAGEFFNRLGMYSLPIRKEIDAFVADRLLEAVWREALWLVKDGIATTAEIDDAIRFGFGLR